ncbi:P-loop containing nucleoside triphosphate hydrolase protein, partial [Globomyces pollinis-pini]
RIQADLMFTYIVNPYKKLPYFTAKEIELYHGSAAYEHPPHIYAVADRMFHNMIVDEENQCVIISGESGAGKTESAKLIMNYIADVSSKGGASTANIVDAVKNIILESNPLLEAFGNAKTLRNNNSSRFGKYFEINFSKSGSPMGGKISNFLLEKSRVVGPGKGERNFHIFYQMTKGVTGEMAEQLGLTKPDYFNYLRCSGEYDADGVNDIEEYNDMSRAMDICQISAAEKNSIFKIVCGILHLGNVDFTEGQNGTSAVIRDPQTLAFPAYLLGIKENMLEAKLLSRLMTTGVGRRGSSYNVELNVEQAKGTRDALAKALYTRMFDWIVQAVNTAMSNLAANLREAQILCLGVLDIFGFEIFEKNGFEQFCINYVNEKLQQIFIELTLKSEQEEYEREGIKWTPIAYFNNQIVVDLIESKRPPGIMAILDDVCFTMHAQADGADTTYLQKLASGIGNHKHYRGMQQQFVIQHYAGSVTYDADGFTEANKDTLFKDLIQLVQSTNDPFLLNLFPDVIDDDNKKRPTTVSFKIKNQSNDLVSTLMRCTPSYVRCIKPNETKRPKDWDSKRVDHQVRYLNLAENIKVRRAGFCYRNVFEKFLKRFAILTKETFPRWNGQPQEGVKIIMESVSMDPKEWQLGSQKVFIKSPESLFLLEESRDRKYHHYAKVIQRAYRRWKSRKYFLEMRKKAADVMYNKKERKRFSVNREFLGDYLNVLDNPILKSLIDNKNEKTLFSDTITKYDRSFKPSSREILITDQHIFIVGSEKVDKGPNKGKFVKAVKRKLQYSEISSVSLSTKQDDIVVIHINNDFDNVFEDILKTELVTVLSENYQRIVGRPLTINFSDSITYTVKKTRWQSGGDCKLVFSTDSTAKGMVFKNSGKTTEIKVAQGLPKDSKPNSKSLFETVKSPLKTKFGGGNSYQKTTTQQTRTSVTQQVQNMNLNGGAKGNLSNFAGSNASLSGSNSNLAAAAAGKRKPPPVPAAKKVPRCTALYKYDASEADELSFNVGDVIVIVSKGDPGWWTGTFNGKTGLFPSNVS